jgi:hypothetical protein
MPDPLETLSNNCDSSGEEEIPIGCATAKDLRKHSSGQQAPQPRSGEWPAHIIVRPLPSRELTCGGCGAHALFNDLLAACYLQSPLLTCGVSAFHVLDLPPAWDEEGFGCLFPETPPETPPTDTFCANWAVWRSDGYDAVYG